ncbi:MAG: flagellar hook protein FlgE [Pseudomonadota bacterium]|jgi:flagellar hook protein FlgE
MDFQQGLSGLNATSRNLAVIGNNVANSNTFGSKASRAEFADMVSGSGASTVGIGVRLQTVSQAFTQGGMTTTDNPMDLAISGTGFFQLKDDAGITYYGRNGQFKVNSDGYIVNNDGLRLQGYGANSQGTILPSSMVDLRLPNAGIAPQQTTQISMALNLDSRMSITKPAAATGTTIDFNDAKTFNNATSLSVFDVKGQEVALTVYFQKDSVDTTTGEVTWNAFATANGTPTSVDGNGQPVAFTQVKFPLNGAAPSFPVGTISLDIPATSTTVNGVTNQISEAISGVKVDLSKATQFGAAFNVTELKPDGYAPGNLSDVKFEVDGTITARYSNGKTLSMGQVQLANFRNPQGLQPLGSNVWLANRLSGEPITGTPGAGSLGALQAGTLESSNVDLTAELINMIAAQRSYQANAQTIKTQDQVLQTLVSMR